MRSSGLVLLTPELEPRIADLRERHDPAARQGMPAHVTLLYPFMPPERMGAAERARLAETIGAFAPFELSFPRIGRFPEVLWVSPEPAPRIVGLVRAIAAAFPEYPPYAGQFDTIIPHVTVAHGDGLQLGILEPEVRSRLGAPIRQPVTHVALFTTIGRRWREVDRFALA